MKVLITIEVPETAQVIVDGPPPKPAIAQVAAAGLIDDIPWPDETLSHTDALAAQDEKRLPVCPEHHLRRMVPVGSTLGESVTWKNGKKGKAFLGCPERDCKWTFNG